MQVLEYEYGHLRAISHKTAAVSRTVRWCDIAWLCPQAKSYSGGAEHTTRFAPMPERTARQIESLCSAGRGGNLGRFVSEWQTGMGGARR